MQLNNYKKKCIIGFTGFIGKNITKQINFDDYYNSKNINDIKMKTYDLIFFCGTPGSQFYANLYPEKDTKIINDLIKIFSTVKCSKFVLISTVCVFDKSIKKSVKYGNINNENLNVYGKNRLLFENFVINEYSDHHVIRLPQTYGKNFSKGLLYDYITRNKYINKYVLSDRIQLYSIEDLVNDLNKIINNKIKIINLVPEPTEVKKIVKCFSNYTIIDNENIKYNNKNIKLHHRENNIHVTTKYNYIFSNNGLNYQPYIYNENTSLKKIKKFIQSEINIKDS